AGDLEPQPPAALIERVQADVGGGGVVPGVELQGALQRAEQRPVSHRPSSASVPAGEWDLCFDVSAEGVIEDAHQVDIDDRALPSSQQAPAARAAERDERTHLIWLVCGSKSVYRRCRRRPGSGRLCVRSGGAGGGTGQPGHGALDLPPVPAQPLRVLHTLAGQAMDDPAFTEPAAQVVVVIALVAVQLGRTTSPWAAPGPDRRDPAH